ncbi:MAG: septum formation initiator family protein [Patescibacteria group bacterium]|nr:septum formation initiator family protein [Patescibacteria group bacterium]MDD4611126.1 septum formation initiator family protein [Patescibacteria group bacterium]
MYQKPKYNSTKKFFSRQKALGILGLAVIIFISIPLAKNITKRYTVNKELKELQKEISDLENRNKDFKGVISYLESDQFVEEQARLNLNLKKEGEKVIIIKEEALATSTNINSDEESISNFQCWINYFFKNRK